MRKRNVVLGMAMMSVTLFLAGCGTANQPMDGENAEVIATENERSESVDIGNTEEAVSADSEEDATYIVENQEYVYAPYSSIGQLGEEGDYFSEHFPTDVEKETIVYETTADVTQDGIDDLVQVAAYNGNSYENIMELMESTTTITFVKVYRGTDSGEFEAHPRFISRDFCIAHAGNGTICLSHKDGKDYLLVCGIYEIQGIANYDYAAVYISDEDGIVVADSAGVEFSVDRQQHNDWEKEQHREDAIPGFKEKIDAWIEDATILVSLNVDSAALASTAEEEIPASAFFDTVWARDW